MSSQCGSDWSSGWSLWHSACTLGWFGNAGLWCISHPVIPITPKQWVYMIFDDSWCLQLGSFVRITPWNGWCLLPPSSQAAISDIGKSENQPCEYLHVFFWQNLRAFYYQIYNSWHLEKLPSPKDVLYTYGFYLGLAFQIADDVLDFTGGR